MEERKFIHNTTQDRFFEVIERNHDGSYRCVGVTTRPINLTETPRWPLVGLAEVAAGRLRGATIFTYQPTGETKCEQPFSSPPCKP